MQQVLVRSYRARSKSSRDSEADALTALERDANSLYEQGYELRQLFGQPPGDTAGMISSEHRMSLYAVYHLVDLERAKNAASREVSVAPMESTQRFQVELVDAGKDEHGVIEVLMKLWEDTELDSVGPLHVNRIIGSAPTALEPTVSRADAELARRRLEAKGARVRVTEVG